MAATPTLQFLGASGTVTGSKYLVRCEGGQFLLDCGLFQGLKELRLRNWQPPPFDAAGLDAVVISHAHIDHTGYLPLLARHRYRGPIYATAGTAELIEVLLEDAARLQEEEAEMANRHQYSKHKPALPLYTSADTAAALRLVQKRPYYKPFDVVPGVTALYRHTGHILGAASIEVDFKGPSPVRLVFSGDIGRYDRPILHDPVPVPEADVLMIEATYGDRVHPPDPISDLARVVTEAAARGGALIVPAFAVGRTQDLVWMLRSLEDEGRIPILPVYLDSPMAIDVTDIYTRHPEEYDPEMAQLMNDGRRPLRTRQYHLARKPDESKAINRQKGPLIVIAGNGMATGGRVLHHLKLRVDDPRTTVLLVGYQAAGTRGRLLQDGAKFLRFHGQDVPVRAAVASISGLSAHADREELARWLTGFTRPPRRTYIVHGEPGPAQSMAELIRTRFGWHAEVARDGETVPLGEPAA